MRIVLSIDQNWTVKSNIPALPVRHLVKTPDGEGGIVPTIDAAQHSGETTGGLMSSGGQAIFATYSRLLGRAINQGDPEAFGRYLFDCLLGSSWDLIRD